MGMLMQWFVRQLSTAAGRVVGGSSEMFVSNLIGYLPKLIMLLTNTTAQQLSRVVE